MRTLVLRRVLCGVRMSGLRLSPFLLGSVVSFGVFCVVGVSLLSKGLLWADGCSIVRLSSCVGFCIRF